MSPAFQNHTEPLYHGNPEQQEQTDTLIERLQARLDKQAKSLFDLIQSLLTVQPEFSVNFYSETRTLLEINHQKIYACLSFLLGLQADLSRILPSLERYESLLLAFKQMAQSQQS